MHEMEMMNDNMIDDEMVKINDEMVKWYVDIIGQFAHMNPP